jgi:hypothetical protein
LEKKRVFAISRAAKKAKIIRMASLSMAVHRSVYAGRLRADVALKY